MVLERMRDWWMGFENEFELVGAMMMVMRRGRTMMGRTMM